MTSRLGLGSLFVLALSGCPGDDSSGDADTGTGGTTGTAGESTGGGGTMTGADSGSTGGDTGTTAADSGSSEDSGGSSESSTGAAVDCSLLPPISDPPEPMPPAGACGYVLPVPNPDCGPQPMAGALMCAASSEVFDPTMGEEPEFTDFRCINASSGGYCLELQEGGLYTFCTQALTSLDELETYCIPCFIEVDGILEVSWEDGPTWTAPDCV